MHSKYLLIIGIIYNLSFSVNAQDSKRPLLHTHETSSLISLDGELTEEVWELCADHSRFIQIEPKQDTLAKANTSVKVLFDDTHLYFGIEAEEPLGKKAIRATDLKRDFAQQQHDVIAIALDAFNDERNAVVFAVNPYGAQRDYLSIDDRLYDVDWDAQWMVRTKIKEKSWVAEIAIPWKTLRYKKDGGKVQQWGFNAYRSRRVLGIQDAFSSYPRVFTYARMSYAGILSGLTPPPPSTNLRLNPYLLYDAQSNNGEIKDKVKLGGELKWAISSNDVLDITVNTDFAQADVDRKVNNITRFSVFFPERRAFFLENSSLFSAGRNPKSIDDGGSLGIQPFFSRRIGLDNDGTPVPLQFGSRYVHRSVSSNYGGMFVRQHDGKRSSNFGVARYSRNIGNQNRIGVLVTIKNSTINTNTVGAIDGFFRLDDNQSISTMLSLSNDSHSSKSGLSGYVQYYYKSNRFKFWLTESIIQEDYNPEIGFVSRKNVLATTPGINWFYRGRHIPLKKYLRGFYPGVAMEIYHDLRTQEITERQFFINPIWLAFHNNGYFGYSIYPTYQNLSRIFSPLGVNISDGAYNYLRHQVLFRNDPSKFISGSANITWGSYFDGSLSTQSYAIKFSPIPHLSFGARYNRNTFQNVGDVDRKTVNLYTIDARLALNPRLQLTGFYQATTENNARNYNIRLSYEFKPLSYLYLVFNKNEFQSVENGVQRQMDNSGFIGKVSYIYQF